MSSLNRSQFHPYTAVLVSHVVKPPFQIQLCKLYERNIRKIVPSNAEVKIKKAVTEVNVLVAHAIQTLGPI